MSATLAAPAAIDFHCHACGRCCNSAPQLTLAEMFKWDTRFIGALRIKVREVWRAGQRLGGARHASRPLANEDITADALLGQSLAFDLPGGRRLQLSLTGIDYPSLARCPQLQADGLCALHSEGKPVMCATVPLDPWLPDRLQDVVLHRRSAGGPEDLGADCLRASQAPGIQPLEFRPLWRDGQIVDTHYRAQLGLQRRDLAQERRLWGQALFAQLQRDMALAALPQGQEIVLPLAPLLLHLAGHSEHCHGRVRLFLLRQITLIEQGIASAMTRRHAADRPFTEQLRQHLTVNRRLIDVLGTPPGLPNVDADMARETESLLQAGSVG